MNKRNLNRTQVIEAAAMIAEEQGLEAVTLKAVADRLQIRTPSLYNHIKSLADLKYQLSLYSLKYLTDELLLTKEKNGNDAVRVMGMTYIKFAREHRGLYETTQWLNMWNDENVKVLFEPVVELLTVIYNGYGLTELELAHLIRGFRSIIHGFAAIESNNGFGHDSSIEESFAFTLDIFLAGIKNRYMK